MQQRSYSRLITGLPKLWLTNAADISSDRKPFCDLEPSLQKRLRAYTNQLDRNIEAGRGLWFMGRTGTFKTAMAVAIAKRAAAAGFSAAYRSVPQVLSFIRAAYDDDRAGEAYEDKIRKLITVDLLLLDDMGAEQQTDWVLSQLYMIIDGRMEAMKPVIVTTNLTVEELEEQVGERVVSRLFGICGEPLAFEGQDWRRLQAAA